MKTSILILLLLLAHTAIVGQNGGKKKGFFSINMAGQKITDNSTPDTMPYFESDPTNIDYQLKIGRIFYRERMVAGMALNLREVNLFDIEAGRDEIEDNDYITRTEFSLGLFTRYYLYDQLFVEGYLGLFGLARQNFLPTSAPGSITKYGLTLGYSIQLWHFVAIEPSIGIISQRMKLRGNSAPTDDIGQFSIGLGLSFKLP